MPKLNPELFLDDDYDASAGRRQRQENQKHSRHAKRVAGNIAEQMDRIEHIHFTYNASRHEQLWIVNSLSNFYELHWFSDVLRLIKGGKEASVYQCQADPAITANYIAAKIYRPRKFRIKERSPVSRRASDLGGRWAWSF
jgi:serine/threonine-protein kinase RIO1